MKDQDLTITISVDKTSKEAYDAINNVRGCGRKKLKAVQRS